jgi:trigger factor
VSLEAYLRATEQTEDDLRAEMRPAALERLRNSLLLRAIAEKEEIEVSDEDLDAAVARMSIAAQETERPEQAEQFARSEYVRELLQSEYFERQLTERLIEIATEGRGSVINAWEPPVVETEPADQDESAVVSETETVATEAAPDAETAETVPATEGDEA